MASKVKDAEVCIRNAEKHLKTSLLKWTPDYDDAATEYEKAATIFKNARDINKCVEYHLKAAECFEKSKSFFSAAKSYEQTALHYGKELNQLDKSIEMFEKACFMYREHGVPDTAALCLDRGAKLIEAKNPEKAATFYAQSTDISMNEGKTHQAAEFAGKCARIHIKLRSLDKAAEMIDKQLMLLVEDGDGRSAGRIVVYKVLIHLSQEDFVAAKKAFVNGAAYMEQQELNLCNAIVEAFDEVDSKKIVSLLNHPFVKTLDNEYAKLARDLAAKHGGKSQNSPSHGGLGEPEPAPEPVDEEAAAML